MCKSFDDAAPRYGVRLTRASQRLLVVTALSAALLSLAALHPRHADAGHVLGRIAVAATVVESVTIRALYQAQNLVISAQHIARGYVDVASAWRFDIVSKGAYLFEFRPVGDLLRSFSVTLPHASAQFGAGGGTVLQSSHDPGTSKIEVAYRLELRPDVTAGSHRWPVYLTVLPL